MGTWGSSLYANDSTCDVRDTYLGFLEKQATSQKAYEKTLKKCKEYIGDPDEPLFWFALVETQWSVGRLMPEVKEKALAWIDQNGGMELWEDNNNGGAGWKETLEKLRIQLESEQPKEKVFRRRVIPFQNPWGLFDIYAYRIHRGSVHPDERAVHGKYFLMQKIGEGPAYYSTDTIMRVQIFDRLFDELPSVEDALVTLREYRLLPFSYPADQKRRFILRLQGKRDPGNFSLPLCQYDPIKMSFLLDQYYPNKNARYPKEEVTYICTMEGPPNIQHERTERTANTLRTWDDIHYKIGQQIARWRDIEYDIVGDGTFEYPTREQKQQIIDDLKK